MELERVVEGSRELLNNYISPVMQRAVGIAVQSTHEVQKKINTILFELQSASTIDKKKVVLLFDEMSTLTSNAGKVAILGLVVSFYALNFLTVFHIPLGYLIFRAVFKEIGYLTNGITEMKSILQYTIKTDVVTKEQFLKLVDWFYAYINVKCIFLSRSLLFGQEIRAFPAHIRELIDPSSDRGMSLIPQKSKSTNKNLSPKKYWCTLTQQTSALIKDFHAGPQSPHKINEIVQKALRPVDFMYTAAITLGLSFYTISVFTAFLPFFPIALFLRFISFSLIAFAREADIFHKIIEEEVCKKLLDHSLKEDSIDWQSVIQLFNKTCFKLSQCQFVLFNNKRILGRTIETFSNYLERLKEHKGALEQVQVPESLKVIKVIHLLVTNVFSSPVRPTTSPS